VHCPLVPQLQLLPSAEETVHEVMAPLLLQVTVRVIAPPLSLPQLCENEPGQRNCAAGQVWAAATPAQINAAAKPTRLSSAMGSFLSLHPSREREASDRPRRSAGTSGFGGNPCARRGRRETLAGPCHRHRHACRARVRDSFDILLIE
jgi:hypothetical protein